MKRLAFLFGIIAATAGGCPAPPSPARNSDLSRSFSEPDHLPCRAGECPPTKPDDLRIASSTETSLTLEWYDRADDEQGFRIYRRRFAGLDPDPDWALAGTRKPRSGTGVTTWQDADLAADLEYCYYVVAFNDFGDSDAEGTECGETAAARSGVIRSPDITFTYVYVDYADSGSNDADYLVFEIANEGSVVSGEISVHWEIGGGAKGAFTTLPPLMPGETVEWRSLKYFRETSFILEGRLWSEGESDYDNNSIVRAFGFD